AAAEPATRRARARCVALRERTDWPVALAVTTVGGFLAFLDVTIVNVALAAMQNDFGAATNDIQWVTTAYTLTMGVTLPASGWLGDRFGLTRVYLWSLLGFALVSMLCGAAWGLGPMIAFRVLQAIPGAIIPTVSMAMTHRIVPKDKLGIGVAVNGISAVLAPAIGPTLGGYLVEHQSWRLVFFINLPISVLGLILVAVFAPPFPPRRSARFDTWGFATAATGLFALLLAISKASDWGWSSYPVLILLTASALLLALFVVIELEVDHPMLNPRLFRSHTFSVAQILMGILGSGYFAVLFYIPLFLQESQHITPIHTGLAMLPEAITMVIFAPVAGLLYDKVGARWPAVIGLLIVAFSSYLMCSITWDLSRESVMVWTSIRSCGYVLAIVSVLSHGIAAVPAEYVDEANAWNNLTYRIAAALVLSVLNAIAAAVAAQLALDNSPPHTALPPERDPKAMLPLYEHFLVRVQAGTLDDLFFIMTMVTLVGALLALLLPTGRPATAQPAAAVNVPTEPASPATHPLSMPTEVELGVAVG
ncbi:MAG TPA: MDR family MFS transporter, partial [Pseudonocardia sp.]